VVQAAAEKISERLATSAGPEMRGWTPQVRPPVDRDDHSRS
jgi:hypothetical protein